MERGLGDVAETVFVFNTGDTTVSVVDVASGEVTATIPVGPQPYGTTAATVRPGDGDTASLQGRTRTAGVEVAGTGTGYCIGNCACEHQL